MQRKLTQVEIYWDSQDPNNEGWAERLTYDDGHQESGPCDLIDTPEASRTELQEAIVALAWQNGIEIRDDEVAVEPNVDGGYAEWTAD
jgi:hypothetical protein